MAGLPSAHVEGSAQSYPEEGRRKSDPQLLGPTLDKKGPTESASLRQNSGALQLRADFRPWMHLRKPTMLAEMRESSFFTCSFSALSNSNHRLMDGMIDGILSDRAAMPATDEPNGYPRRIEDEALRILRLANDQLKIPWEPLRKG